jgi:hypothetical protein
MLSRPPTIGLSCILVTLTVLRKAAGMPGVMDPLQPSIALTQETP